MASSFCVAAAMVVSIAATSPSPALLLGFPQPVDEVGVDPFQPRHLSRVDGI